MPLHPERGMPPHPERGVPPHPERGMPPHPERGMPPHPVRGVPPHPVQGMQLHPERGVPPHPERGSTSTPSGTAPLPRTRQHLYPERGSTSAQSGAVPLHRARRTGKFDFTYTIRFAVRFKFSLTENLMKKHRGGGSEHGCRHFSSSGIDKFRALLLECLEHSEQLASSRGYKRTQSGADRMNWSYRFNSVCCPPKLAKRKLV